MSKRIVNLCGSLVVAAFDWVRRRTCQLLGLMPSRTCVVLAYHSVKPADRVRFACQLDELVRHAEPVRADAGSIPNQGGRYVAVTFDDGLANVIENALPELKKREIPATLFIVTDVLGGNPGWEYFGGDDPSEEKTMTADQLCDLPPEYITIGSHSATHPVLPTIDDEQLREELRGSRNKLEAMLNRKVTLFSFPYGSFDERVIKACREAGYDRVFTALPVIALTRPQEFLTGRVVVTPTDWPIEFRLKLAGAYRWLPYAFALKRKLLSAIGRDRGLPLTFKVSHEGGA